MEAYQRVKVWGLPVAKEADLTALIIETDCLEVAELMNNRKRNRKEIFWTISEAQKSMSVSRASERLGESIVTEVIYVVTVSHSPKKKNVL